MFAFTRAFLTDTTPAPVEENHLEVHLLIENEEHIEDASQKIRKPGRERDHIEIASIDALPNTPDSSADDDREQQKYEYSSLRTFSGSAIPMHDECCSILLLLLDSKGYQNDWRGGIRPKICFDFFKDKVNSEGTGCKLDYEFDVDAISHMDFYDIIEGQEVCAEIIRTQIIRSQL